MEYHCIQHSSLQQHDQRHDLGLGYAAHRLHAQFVYFNRKRWSCSGTSTVTCTTTGGISGGANSIITLTVDVPAASAVSVTNTAKAWGGGDLTHTSLGYGRIGVTDTATVIQVPASVTINNRGGTQSTAIGTAFAIALICDGEDAGSVAIPLYPVTFTANPGSNGQSGTFSNSTNTIQIATNGSGVASAGTFTANNKIGSYTVSATAGSVSATFNLTNLRKSQTTFASLTTTAATIDVFGFGFTAPSGSLAFTDVTTSTPVVAPVTLNTATGDHGFDASGDHQHRREHAFPSGPSWPTSTATESLDLITSLYNTDSVNVQLGNGDGTFQAATTYPDCFGLWSG